MTVKGIDLSRWQPFVGSNYDAVAADGYKYAALRCTVGDYYSDAYFPTHWKELGDRGFLLTPYLVVAPADSYGRKISASAHINRFLSAFGDREAELPWVLDCELDRGQSVYYITDLILDITCSIYEAIDRYPIIYTRQSWWDYYTYADPMWKSCPLWAARYSNTLTSPWSDGYHKFRDWSEWTIWQWTSHGRIPPYPGDIDMDRFNGDEDDLMNFANQLTPMKKLDILWREAGLHNWNLTL